MYIEIIEQLIGKLKEGKYIKKRYLQMILSSSIELKKNLIEAVNESHKRNGSPMSILDKRKLKPGKEVQMQVNVNPVLSKKSITLE